VKSNKNAFAPSCKTEFFDNLIIETLSQNIVVALFWWWFRCSKVLLNQTHWHVHNAVAINYASVDKLTTSCFFDVQEITPSPNKKE